MKRYLAIVSLLAAMGGCGQPRETAVSAFETRDSTYAITILLDMSGSFRPLMADQGKAYRFSLQVIDQYFRDRIGMDDQLVIAHISGSDRALLWQGTPLQLRRDFPNAHAFRQMLIQNSKHVTRGLATEPLSGPVPASNIHESIGRTLDYLMSEPGVASGKVQSAVFILSDMIDNGADTEKSRQDAIAAMTRFGQAGHAVGIYYCDQLLVEEWRKLLGSSGIKNFYVGSGIESKPVLPSFD